MITLHVINQTGDQLGIYYMSGARVATVVGESACVDIRQTPGVEVVLGFKRTAEPMIYAAPTIMDGARYWEIIISRISRTGTIWPYQTNKPVCK